MGPKVASVIVCVRVFTRYASIMLAYSFQLSSPSRYVHRAVEFVNREVFSLPSETYGALWITFFAS